MLTLKTNDKRFGYIILEISYLKQVFCTVGHLRGFNVRCALWMPRLWHLGSLQLIEPKNSFFLSCTHWRFLRLLLQTDVKHDSHTHRKAWLFRQLGPVGSQGGDRRTCLSLGHSVWFQRIRVCPHSTCAALRPPDSATPRTVARQTPLSMGFSMLNDAVFGWNEQSGCVCPPSDSRCHF